LIVVVASDLFRAIMEKNEISDRAFLLTEEMIRYNPANYTAWYFRRICLFELKKPFLSELEFVRDWTERSSKNYQVWYHRRWVVDNIGQDCDEKAMMDDAIEEDAKNYNAWGYRQWLIKRFDLWDGEFDFVKKLILEDCRNNSAWNHRRFLVERHPLNLETIINEIEFSIHWIQQADDNEVTWRYLFSFLRGSSANVKEEVDVIEQAISKVLQLVKTVLVHNPDNRFALEAKYDILSRQFSWDSASEVLNDLKRSDPVRQRFWEMTRQSVLSNTKSVSAL